MAFRRLVKQHHPAWMRSNSKTYCQHQGGELLERLRLDSQLRSWFEPAAGCRRPKSGVGWRLPPSVEEAFVGKRVLHFPIFRHFDWVWIAVR